MVSSPMLLSPRLMRVTAGRPPSRRATSKSAAKPAGPTHTPTREPGFGFSAYRADGSWAGWLSRLSVVAFLKAPSEMHSASAKASLSVRKLTLI